MRDKLSFTFINGQKMMHAAVNTDPIQLDPTPDSKESHYGLKERNIPHMKVSQTKELKAWYDFGKKLGEGAFGTVVTVTERRLRKQWAMKSISKQASIRTGASRLEMVHRELQVLKMISHPHIIYLDRVFETPRHIYLVFELCHTDFNKIYQQHKPFSEMIARKIVTDLVDAVAYLHKYDIVHRDLKMENILLGDNPEDPADEYYIKLTDFGLSIVKYGKSESMLHDFCGTLYYMAPEMITVRCYSQMCDMWSIGVILYMLVIGEYPFFSTNDRELQAMICSEEPIFDNNELSDEVKDLILMLLVKDPVKRIRATEALKHEWILNRKLSKPIEYNILKKMKEWKSEMKLETGAVSDWVANTQDNSDLNKPKKQALNLPKTNIEFDRNRRKSSTKELQRSENSDCSKK